MRAMTVSKRSARDLERFKARVTVGEKYVELATAHRKGVPQLLFERQEKDGLPGLQLLPHHDLKMDPWRFFYGVRSAVPL